jgi:pentatricopeptide repeat protein
MDLQHLACDDPYKARDALHIMQQWHSQSVSSLQPRQNTIQPDVSCYTTVIGGFVDAGLPEAAEEVLTELEQLATSTASHHHNNNDNTTMPSSNDESLLRPTEATYMLVAQGWVDQAKDDASGQPAERAEAILYRMRQNGLEPSVKIWSIVLEGTLSKHDL